MVHGGSLRRYGHLRIDAACLLYGTSVGKQLYHRNLYYAVAVYIGARSLQVEEYYRAGEIKSHYYICMSPSPDKLLEIAYGHRHEEHYQLCVVGLFAWAEHAGTSGIAEVDDYFLALRVVSISMR